MSAHLQWMVVRNCSSFLIKRNEADVQHRKWGPDTSVGGEGPALSPLTTAMRSRSQEPNNLKARNSFR